MTKPETLEVWLRGPVSGVPSLLQPVAHALLQAREELNAAMHDFPPALLNERPAGVASVGFHLQHLAGVLTASSPTPAKRRYRSSSWLI